MTISSVNTPEELIELKDFLKSNGLPYEDIHPENSSFFLYRVDSGEIAGCGGLEFYEQNCLLRSVAVAQNLRGKSYGKNIAKDLIEKAKSNKLQGIYLLTETAQPFFERLAFKSISRDMTPNSIRLSSEFSSVCPVSAQLMFLSLT